MDHGSVLALFDQQIREQARPDGPGATVERVGAVVRQTAPDGGWNGVLWSGLQADASDADAAIADQIRHFGPLGQEFEWKHYSHDEPGDLAERLVAAGFTPEPPETLMVADVRELPTFASLPVGVRLRQVTTVADIQLVADVHDQAFGSGGERIRQRLLALLSQDPDAVGTVLAMAGDEPVCAARLELHAGTDFGSLWGGGTVEAWRGRGIYRALVAYRAGIAHGQGYRYLQVDASDQSRPILRRLGFAELSVTTPYIFEA